jgi:hypothetical protein
MRLASIPSLGLLCAALFVPCRVSGQEYVPQLLETPEGYVRCTAIQSNDGGVVIGTCDQRAVAWRDGIPDVLPLPSGFTDSRGYWRERRWHLRRKLLRRGLLDE